MKIFLLKRHLILLLIALSLCGCDKPTSATANVVESAEMPKEMEKASSYPEDVLKVLEEKASMHFKDNAFAKKEWLQIQLQSYDSIVSYIPNFSLEDFAKIKETIAKKYPYDFPLQYKMLTYEVDAYKQLEKNKYSNKALYDEVIEKVNSENLETYKEQLNSFCKWEPLIEFANSLINDMPIEAVTLLKENAIKESQISVKRGMAYLVEQRNFYINVKNWRGKTFSKDVCEQIKENIREKFPYDFKLQYENLKKIEYDKKNDPSFSLNGLLARTEKILKNSQPKKIEDTFRTSVFTKRGVDNDIFSAILVKMNGKTVILAGKEFLSEQTPIAFENSKGRIVCSKIFVSKEHPLLLLIPDEEPTAFTPIEIISPEEAFNLPDKKLQMIAPYKSGIMTKFVSAFSEDALYINMTSESAPDVSRKITIAPLDRDANKILTLVTDTVDVGENALVFDTKSNKLASISLRRYNPGNLSDSGKSGSIIGHEKSYFPDFNTLVRQFDGNTSRTAFKPMSSIRFIRLSSLKNWEPITFSELNSQKTKIRKFTDDNNDFLRFFKNNSFDGAMNLRRLSSIVERYKKSLLYDNSDRATFERTYKKYMLDVLFAMRREMIQYTSTQGFYSIYNDELQYQINLRKAMYNYLADAVKEDSIINILHVDLQTRYNSPSTSDYRATSSEGASSINVKRSRNSVTVF